MFICGGPCHLSSFKQCSGDFIFLREQLVYSGMERNETFLSLYHYLNNNLNMYIYVSWDHGNFVIYWTDRMRSQTSSSIVK